MKPAKYESSTGALAAFLAARPQAAALFDLYTITLVGGLNGGAPLCYTTCDLDILVPYSPTPVNYSSRQVYFDQIDNKAYGHWKVGVDVDTWQVIAAPVNPNTGQGSGAMIGNQTWLAAVIGGALDGAVVAVDRAFFDIRNTRLPAAGPISPLGVVNVFTGRIAEVDLGRSSAVLNINSHLELLGITMPRNLWQAGCRWTLFGSGCTLAAASFAVAGTVAANAGGGVNPISVTVAAPGGSGTYALGRIVMNSGKNAGFARSIRSWTAGAPASFQLLAPFAFPLAAGDSFTAYPGCDKLLDTCVRFGNEIHFGGMPWVPAPETAAGG